MNARTKALVDGPRVLAVVAGLLLTMALLVALLGAGQAQAKSTATIKKAALSGSGAFARVNGEAKWKAKEGERELEVQIEDAKPLAGKTLTVRVGGKVVGHMKVSALGRARLAKSTQAGQSVPASVAGKAVKITTRAGKLVATGKF